MARERLMWKVRQGHGRLIGTTLFVEEAAALVAMQGEGATITWDSRVLVWTEGQDGNAIDSYDAVADVARAKLKARRARAGVK